MNIAIFVGTFPVLSETFIVRQITGLMDLGHHVDIFADTRPDSFAAAQPELAKQPLSERTIYMDMPPEAAPYEMPVWPITGRTWLPGASTSTLNAIRAARAFPKWIRCVLKSRHVTRQVLNKSEYSYRAASLSSLYRLAKLSGISRHYDILHAHFGPLANSFRFARALWQTPLVVSFHGYDIGVVPRAEGRDVYRNLFRDADTVILNCECARERIYELGCPREHIRILYYGVDMSAFAFGERSREAGQAVRLLTVGRLVEKKGIEFAIRAVAMACEKHPELHYDIIGDGPLRASHERLIGECNLQNHVTLHGARDNSFVRDRMAQAHIFILPSVTADNGDQEGTPVSLIEAQASGLPTLSTRHSGIPEVVIDAQSGFLVAERDVPALAEKLSILIESPQVCLQFGACGRKHVGAQFDLHRSNRDLIGVYEDTVRRFVRPK